MSAMLPQICETFVVPLSQGSMVFEYYVGFDLASGLFSVWDDDYTMPPGYEIREGLTSVKDVRAFITGNAEELLDGGSIDIEVVIHWPSLPTDVSVGLRGKHRFLTEEELEAEDLG